MVGLPLVLESPKPWKGLESTCHETLEQRLLPGPVWGPFVSAEALPGRPASGWSSPPPCLEFWVWPKLCESRSSRIGTREGVFPEQASLMGECPVGGSRLLCENFSY